jgi:hypothetical protein
MGVSNIAADNFFTACDGVGVDSLANTDVPLLLASKTCVLYHRAVIQVTAIMYTVKDQQLQHPHDVGDIIGLGRWQIQIFLFFCGAAFFSTWENVALPFFAYENPFRCIDNGSLITDTCYVNGTRCTTFLFETSFYKSSIISEWDLVCSESWMSSFSQTMYMIGMLTASITAGYSADRFGRKPVIIIGFMIEILSGFYIAYAPGVWHFHVGRLLTAFGQTARYITGIILGEGRECYFMTYITF